MRGKGRQQQYQGFQCFFKNPLIVLSSGNFIFIGVNGICQFHDGTDSGIEVKALLNIFGDLLNGLVSDAAQFLI